LFFCFALVFRSFSWEQLLDPSMPEKGAKDPVLGRRPQSSRVQGRKMTQ